MVSTHTNLTQPWGEEQGWGPYSQTFLSSPLRIPCITKDLLQLHAAVLCVEHSNCLTAQNNQNPRFKTERVRKGLTERGKKKMSIKLNASHIG